MLRYSLKFSSSFSSLITLEFIVIKFTSHIAIFLLYRCFSFIKIINAGVQFLVNNVDGRCLDAIFFMHLIKGNYEAIYNSS